MVITRPWKGCAMKPWFPHPGVLSCPEETRAILPLWRFGWQKQLQEKPTPDGKPMTREEGDACIDKALASGSLNSEILEFRELWSEPMTRANAEAIANAAIRLIQSRRRLAFLSWITSAPIRFLRRIP